MAVSNISSGAGSVAVSARPALPNTVATSGTDLMSRSVCCKSSDALPVDRPGKRRRHVKKVALVELRHEFATELEDRPRGDRQQQYGGGDRGLRKAKRCLKQRSIRRDEEPVQRIALFVGNASADEIAHQHWDQRDRQARRRRHRVRLGEREWGEQASLLRFQREDRDERQA